MWLTVYLCGALITTLGVWVAADQVSDGDRPPTAVWVGVMAGALWPLVIVGLMQMAVIAIIARPWHVAAVRRSGRASIQLKEVLAFPQYSGLAGPAKRAL